MKNTVLIAHPPKLPDWILQVQMGLMDVDVDSRLSSPTIPVRRIVTADALCLKIGQ